ncbi:MAG: hypothetical protein KC464_10810, partial [Myxococcales bacterium]|nr:hypothetical protein [Myxococcales bacterium]
PVHVGLGVVATGGLIAGLLLAGRACVRHRARTNPGELYAAHVMRAADGTPRLVVVSEALGLGDDASFTTRWRIDLVDPATGRRLRRQLFFDGGRDKRPELLPATPGRFWCDLDGSYAGKRQLLELCGVDTLEVVASQRALIARSPELADGFASSPEVDLGTGALIATTARATTILVDSVELTARPFSPSTERVCLEGSYGGGQVTRASLDLAFRDVPGGAPPLTDGPNCASVHSRDPATVARLRRVPRLAGVGRSQDGTTSSVRAAGDVLFARVDGGQREALTTDPHGNGAGRRIGAATFIHPAALTEYGEADDAMVLPDDAGVILVHQETVDRNTSKLLISRLDLHDGTTPWTVTLPPGEVLLGHREGDLVIVAVRLFRHRQSVVLGLDWHDGAERWRYAM